MNQQAAKRLQAIKPSPTLAMNSRAAGLKAQGKDIISMGVGEPDFNTPPHICEAAVKAMHAGETRYTDVGGTPALKEAIAGKLHHSNALTYELNEILVSTGGKQGLYNLVQAYINPGDEVIIPAPYWVSYVDMVLLAEGTPVTVAASIDQQFKITAEQLDQAITAKTRLLMLNSPSNPTGMSYTREELNSLAEVLRQHPDILIATDDMYEHIYWGAEQYMNIVTACPDLKERTVVLSGVSKAYAMTGWRIGYAAGPSWLIQSMTKLQSHSTANPCSIAQAAACAALTGPQDCVKDMVAEFKRRHDYVIGRLQGIAGVRVLAGQGTFYAFPYIGEVLKNKGLSSDLELVESLLAEGVAVVPGTAFGAPEHLRLSFAAGMDVLEEALNRIARGLT